MGEIPNVRLGLHSRAENVLVVRQALSGVAESIGLDAIQSNDLNTAVSEACNNVVVHAYRDGGGEGPLEVDVYVLAEADAVAVVVRVRGSGMRARRAHEDDRAGMGLPVIDALASRVQFTDLPGGGTEVRMEFAAPNAAALEPIAGAEPRPRSPAAGGPSSTVELGLAPSAIACAVLPRVLCALAARAHFSTDRISDVQLVADVLAANAGDSIGASHLQVDVDLAPRRLELRVGPLRAGRGESLLAAADGLAPVIERLTDATHVARARGEGAETLELRLLDRR